MPARPEGAAARWRRTETELVVALQRRAATPTTTRAARALSHAGEHAAAWLVVGAAGTALDRGRRGRWAGATAAVLGAHAATVVLKRVVRRRRPDDPRVVVGATAPSRLSFPSSHAASTTAAAVVYGRLLGTRATWALVPLMGVSRPLLGLHFPGDVVVGTAVGLLAARAQARGGRR